MKFSNFMSRGRSFDSLFCPGGGFLYTGIVSGKGVCPPSSRVPGGMVEDEIDSRISAVFDKRNESLECHRPRKTFLCSDCS